MKLQNFQQTLNEEVSPAVVCVLTDDHKALIK
jgi:hypothetical protein